MKTAIFVFVLAFCGSLTTAQTVQDVLVNLSQNKPVIAAISTSQLSQPCQNIDQLLTKFGLVKTEMDGCLYLMPNQKSPISTQPAANQVASLYSSLDDDQLQSMWQQGAAIGDFTPEQQAMIRDVLKSQEATGHFGQPLWNADSVEIVIGYRPLVTILLDGKPIIQKKPIENFRWGHNSAGLPATGWQLICFLAIGYTPESNTSPIVAKQSYTLQRLVELNRKDGTELYLEPRWQDKSVWFSKAQGADQAIEKAIRLYDLKKRVVGDKTVLCQWVEGYYRHQLNVAAVADAKYHNDFNQAISRFEQARPDFAFNGVKSDQPIKFGDLTPEQKQAITKLVEARKLSPNYAHVTVLYEPHLVIGVKVPGEPRTNYFNFPENSGG